MNWQSWSPLKKPLIPIPIRNFSPLPDKSISIKKPKNHSLKDTITGICTWYRFGGNIDESKILSFAKDSLSLHPEINYCLIDDGWSGWGDWHLPKFDMSALTQKLSDLKLKSGLWLAPFLVSESSQIFKDHPEYFVRDHKGRLVEGRKMTFFDHLLPDRKYILDFSNPLAKQHIYQSIKRAVTKWNITLLKLDFLYAPYFDPRLKDSSLPHQYLTDLFKWIKKEFPEVYLMACGCPFLPAKYLVDSIRISDDITIPMFYKIPIIRKFLHQRQINLLLEKWQKCQSLSKYFHLDPDVLPVQSLARFSDSQMASLQKIFDQSSVKLYG